MGMGDPVSKKKKTRTKQTTTLESSEQAQQVKV